MSIFEQVFGHGVKFDDAGKPIETGIGSQHHTDQIAAKLAASTAPAAPIEEAEQPLVFTDGSDLPAPIIVVPPLPASVPAATLPPTTLVVPAEAPTVVPVAASQAPPDAAVIPADHPGLIAHLKALLQRAEAELETL